MSISQANVNLAMVYIVVSCAPVAYVSPLIMALMLMLVLCRGVITGGKFYFPGYARPMAVLILAMLISALLSGLSLSDVFSYSAIRYDANILYSAIPIFLLGSGNVDIKKIDDCVRISAVLGGFLYLLGLIVGFDTFDSHNAAGGYFMVLLSYLIGRAMYTGFGIGSFYIIFLTLCLFLSDSRGSMLAVVGATLSAFVWTKNPKILKLILIIFAALSIFVLVAAYGFWVYNGKIYLYDYSGLSEAAKTVDITSISHGQRPGTIAHRILFLYPMAVDMFLNSPIFGIGFTRFDDYPQSFSGIHGLFELNKSSNIIHSNLHAHNSYLHVLAESGIFGLALLLIFIRKVFAVFKGNREQFLAVFVVFGALLIASLTEHRFTTPSQAAPVFMLISLLYLSRSHRFVADS